LPLPKSKCRKVVIEEDREMLGGPCGRREGLWGGLDFDFWKMPI
jgi:hypothetical protein